MNMDLKEQLLARIKTLSEPEMIEVAHELNCWRTHPLIADIMPGSWSWPGDEPIRKSPQSIAMRYVTETVGRKAQLRYHNVRKGRMTEEEFEAWWNKDGWCGLGEL
jgi:hypothetical protein